MEIIKKDDHGIEFRMSFSEKCFFIEAINRAGLSVKDDCKFEARSGMNKEEACLILRKISNAEGCSNNYVICLSNDESEFLLRAMRILFEEIPPLEFYNRCSHLLPEKAVKMVKEFKAHAGLSTGNAVLKHRPTLNAMELLSKGENGITLSLDLEEFIFMQCALNNAANGFAARDDSDFEARTGVTRDDGRDLCHQFYEIIQDLRKSPGTR